MFGVSGATGESVTVRSASVKASAAGTTVPLRVRRSEAAVTVLRSIASEKRTTADAPTARAYVPYVSRKYRDVLLRLTSERLGIRSCDTLPPRVCFLHELERCLAPCEDKVTPTAYRAALRRAGTFLHQ